MKVLLILEEVANLIAAYVVSLYLGFAWWTFPAFLFLPDVSMAGYVLNSGAGAVVYNLFHHQGVSLAALGAGYSLSSDAMLLAGLVLFGHSSLDRALGYGLKFKEGFRHTHLGPIGK